MPNDFEINCERNKVANQKLATHILEEITETNN